MVFENFQLKKEEESGAYGKSLCQFLDGLGKSLNQWKKPKRVPVILFAHSIPKAIRESGPLQKRLIRLPLRNPIEGLSEERLIATLWGCMERRRRAVTQKARQLNQGPEIQYNQTSVKLVDHVIKRDMTKWSLHPDSEFKKEEQERDKSVICTDQGEYATYVYRRSASPGILMDQYGSERTKEEKSRF